VGRREVTSLGNKGALSMRSYFRDLEVPAVAGANGGSVSVRDYRDKTVQILGTFSATLDVQVSLDGGNNYVSVAAALTAPGVHQIPQTCTHIRVRTVAFVSGVPAAVLGAFDARSDV
jgi:hypothetical protein